CRYLGQRSRRARLDRELSAKMEVERCIALGLRSDGAEGLRLYAQPRNLPRMGNARRTSCRWKSLSDLRPGNSVFSERRRWPSFHRHGKFRSPEGVQQLRCLRDRRRLSGRSDSWWWTDQGGVAQGRPATLARCSRRLAEKTGGAWLQGE